MTKKYPEPVLPLDPVLFHLERRFRPISDSPEALRFSQYYLDPYKGSLSALFSQSIKGSPLIIYRIKRISSSHGLEYVLSACAARGTKNLALQTSTPDPMPYAVENILTSAEIGVKQRLREYGAL